MLGRARCTQLDRRPGVVRPAECAPVSSLDSQSLANSVLTADPLPLGVPSKQHPVPCLVICRLLIHNGVESRSLSRASACLADPTITQSSALLSHHASFGFIGLVVPAPMSAFALVLSLIAFVTGPSFLDCAGVAARGSWVGNRTALSTFSVCGPVGRYFGSKRPICACTRETSVRQVLVAES